MDDFEFSSREMAERLMEFIRFVDDDLEEIEEEVESLSDTFELLKADERFNSLAHHLDLMMMDEAFENKEELHLEKRRIAFSTGDTMGDEMIVFETDAPQSRLKELEKESCKEYTIARETDDYDNIPNWFEVLANEGYVTDFIDSHEHVTPFTSSKLWLEEHFRNIDEIYYIHSEQPEQEKKNNKLMIENENLGDLEILNYDKDKNLALVCICNNTLKPYVIADGFDVSDGTWGSGTYFGTIESAEREYRKALNKRMDESRYYQETVKYLIVEDLPDMNLSDEEIDVAFDYLMNESNSPTIINEEDVEELRECIVNHRDTIERKQIIEKQLKGNVREWYLKKWDDDLVGEGINKSLTFDVLDKTSDEEDVYKILGVNDSVVLHRCRDQISEIKHESYINAQDQRMNQRLEGYKGQWSEFDATVRDNKYYRIFENNNLGDETCYVVTDYSCHPIGDTYDDLETALDDLIDVEESLSL